MEKKNNKLLIIIIIAIISILIIGSVLFFCILNKNKLAGQVSFSSPESISKDYIKSILEKDYQSALKYVYTEDNSCNSCITAEDYKNYLEKKIISF